MTEEQAKKLEYPFPSNEIEWRVLITSRDKTKGQVAAYVDSRAIQRRLDAVVGKDNWQNKFYTVSGKDNASTTQVCELSIFYPERSEWITKSDGAGNTDIEPVKGGLSNAFKRAASIWGIGRYLYALTGVWVLLKDGKYIADGEHQKLDAAYDRFLKQYLSKLQGTAGRPAAAPKPSAPAPESATPTVKSAAPAAEPAKAAPPPIKTGRFAGNKAAPQPPGNVCTVLDSKVSRGANQSTMVTFAKPDGEKVTGYIRGAVELSAGQTIRNIKLIPKSHPVAGNYNIIESYQLAA